MNTFLRWTPHIYDYNTKLRELTKNTGWYIKIGGLTFAWFYVNNIDLSGINTMLEFRNLPMSTTFSGSFYIADDPKAGGQLVVQESFHNEILLRPNWTSSIVSNPSSISLCSGFFIGASNLL